MRFRNEATLPIGSIVSLAVADEHDYDGTHTECADAIAVDSSGDGGYVLGCNPLAVPASGGLGPVPPFEIGMSWIPSQGNTIHALAIASFTGTGFYFEASPADVNAIIQPVTSKGIQAMPACNVTFVDNTNCPVAGGWWLTLALAPPTSMLALPHCLASPTTRGLTSPEPLDGVVQLTATAMGGAAVLGLGGADGGSLFAFEVDPGLNVKAPFEMDVGALGATGVRVGRRGAGSVVRAVLLDANGAPYYSDVDFGGTGGWSTPALIFQGAPGGAVFAAPMEPHMVLRVDASGAVSVLYAP